MNVPSTDVSYRSEVYLHYPKLIAFLLALLVAIIAWYATTTFAQQQRDHDAIQNSYQYNASTYVRREEFNDITQRLIRIESKVDNKRDK